MLIYTLETIILKHVSVCMYNQRTGKAQMTQTSHNWYYFTFVWSFFLSPHTRLVYLTLVYANSAMYQRNGIAGTIFLSCRRSLFLVVYRTRSSEHDLKSKHREKGTKRPKIHTQYHISLFLGCSWPCHRRHVVIPFVCVVLLASNEIKTYNEKKKNYYLQEKKRDTKRRKCRKRGEIIHLTTIQFDYIIFYVFVPMCWLFSPLLAQSILKQQCFRFSFIFFIFVSLLCLPFFLLYIRSLSLSTRLFYFAFDLPFAFFFGKKNIKS